MIQGTLNYKDIEFDFILEKDDLKLIPKNDYEKNFQKIFREELDNGAYIDKDNYSIFSDFLYIKIQYIIYLNNQEPISKISIYCKELNGIYDIRRAIEKNDFNKNGEAEVKLKSFDKTQTGNFKFIFKDKEIVCNLNISKTLYGKITEHPVRIRSAITLSFEPIQDYSILSELYNIIEKFIQYLCYRKNVIIEDVNIYTKIEKEKYRQIGTFETIDDDITQEEDKILENRFISYKYIEGHENNILQSIADDSIYMRHFPMTYKEGKRENEATFIMTTAAFEWEFKKLFKNGIPHSQKTKQAKENAIDEIEENL